MSRTKKKALIIGGGIAGPATAMFLQRAGIDAEIFEARAEADDYAGAFLNLASNGLDVLKTLGIHDRITGSAFPSPRLVMWSGTGKRLGVVQNGIELPDGTVSVTVKRGVLHRVLRETATSRGIRFHFGRKLANVNVNAPTGDA